MRGPHAGRIGQRAWPARFPFVRALAYSFNFGLLGSKVYKNLSFLALDADEPPCKILTPLALASAEKSITVQKTNTQTVNDISTPCLSACVDNKID